VTPELYRIPLPGRKVGINPSYKAPKAKQEKPKPEGKRK
jgi:hypothetical protein